MYRKNKNIVRKLKKNVGEDGVELVGEGGLFARQKKQCCPKMDYAYVYYCFFLLFKKKAIVNVSSCVQYSCFSIKFF